MEGNVRMTIVTAVAIHPRSGEVWDELQKQLKKGIEIVKKHGGENVTLLATVIGGQQTNALTMLVTAENWTRFGQVQEAVYGDPEMQALLVETGKIATWEIYAAQTLEL
jgi:hypothetical protein